jgi:ketosteroid isomerase-like protein
VTGENIELAKAFTEAFNARDLDALIDCCHPEIEYHSTFAAVGGDVYHGHDGMRAWYRDMEQTWGNAIRSEPEAYFDLGEDLLVYTVLYGKGKQSGVEAALPVAAVARVREGLFVYYRGFIHREDALEELGVSGDALEPIAP